jgi:Double-GTPase 2
MATVCIRPECTVAQTGRCLLNNDPASCPERNGPILASEVVVKREPIVPPALGKPTHRPRFLHSLSHTPDEIRDLTGKRYYHLVGILGAPDAGKTAILVSLYLLLASGKMSGYVFADSKSIMAVDDISRGTRHWNEGQPPDQMTNHTERADERTPGFLHLRLRKVSDSSTFDLLLPDLPGEWSDALIDRNRIDRLLFLQSADRLWVALDGEQLLNPKLRQQVLHRTHVLFQRISKMLSPKVPPVLLVISHLDAGKPDPKSIQSLQAEAGRFGIPLTVASVASFSDEAMVSPGSGIAGLIDLTMKVTADDSAADFWPDQEPSEGNRQILHFRNRSM